jgi:hypothetical protein
VPPKIEVRYNYFHLLRVIGVLKAVDFIKERLEKIKLWVSCFFHDLGTDDPPRRE